MKKVLLGVALAVVVLSLVGGYGLHWSWTGFSANGSVWDWLSLCLLPITLTFVPLAYEASSRALLTIAVILAVPLGVLLIGGYGLGWSWTGFARNTRDAARSGRAAGLTDSQNRREETGVAGGHTL